MIEDNLMQWGKDDIKGRHYPRSYAIWAGHNNRWDYQVTKIVGLNRAYVQNQNCDDLNPYICQRPAAALEGPESLAWKGCYSATFVPSGHSSYESELMTVDYCGHMCQDGDMKFMGIEQTKCYCLDTIANAQLLSNRACATKCAGDPAQLCGGKGALSIHQLINDTFTDVLGVAGKKDESGNDNPVHIIKEDGEECTDHNIPDLPDDDLHEMAFTVIHDHTIVGCGGTTKNNKWPCKFNYLIQAIFQSKYPLSDPSLESFL